MTKPSTPKEPVQDADTLPSDENQGLPAIRKECLKLAHSAGKPIYEILRDAAIYTTWVLTGEMPPQN